MNILNKRILSLIAIVLFVCLATQAQPPEFKRTADPNYSPDGKFIVYSASISKGSDEVSKGLSIMSADGTKIKSLTPNVNDLFDGFPAFSPDGKRIVFLRGIGKAYPDVWVINSDGSGLKQLTKTKENELRPEFNHDGTGVVFVRNVSRSWSSEYGSLHSIDLTSFTEQQILASDYQVTHAVPTSRGLYLVAMAKFDATGKPDRAAKGNQITLVSPTGEVSPKAPVALPDGNPIITRIQTTRVGEFKIYATGDGKWPERVAFLITPKIVEKLEDCECSMSPDGAKLITSGNGSMINVKGIREARGVTIGTK
ncbi:MAG TPA: hypothetical protein PLP07_09700 [Pyrinomonadaceae bacterium]|nr:PD40 domain-containing protein [Chloracidobacterium sp.]MBL0241806.1 PD40 domain-containing protein [Chloracidobacterium sp.]MBP9934307.1 PD40 domain-containing protein [Pyrinomonadaceae bacterium]HQX56191.1 hypothetical protein [Pyrinomonadaceae bacterium]HQY65878.1 hypothetical protein [Pyrinomonadaceae bacterium]